MYTYDVWNANYSIAMVYVGLLSSCFLDSLYANAGLEGRWLPRTVHRNEWWIMLRAIASFWSMVAMWIGLYDILQYFVLNDEIWRDIMLIILGIVGIHASNTFYCFCYIYPDDDADLPSPTTSSTFWHHAVHSLRAVVALLSQNALWIGFYDLSTNMYELNAINNVQVHDINLNPSRFRSTAASAARPPARPLAHHGSSR